MENFLIDGVASTPAIDTAGEVVDLNGLDCSTLIGGALNFEHKSDTVDVILGKILGFKKIFSIEDCENERHLHFWNKCQMPFLYCIGRLFNDKASSEKIAHIFRDDAEHPDEPPMLGFSIEGSKLEKKGHIVTRSIARKLTITLCSANKQCEAEMVPIQESKPEDDFSNIFKSESNFGLGFLYSDLTKADILPFKKPGTATPAAETPKDPRGTKMGVTGSGKEVHTHAKIHDYKNFSAADHNDASKMHYQAAQSATDHPTASHHRQKMNLHNQALRTAERKTARPTVGMAQRKQAIKDTGFINTIKKSELLEEFFKSEMLSSSLTTDEEANSLMNRIEDKYFVSKSALDYLTQTIKENLKSGDIDTEVRYNLNRSIYLDNEDLDSLKDTLNSVKPRIKIRIRQYSPNGEGWEKVAYVEIKAKESDGMTKKLRIRILHENIEGFIQGQPIKFSEDLANINKDISKEILLKRIATVNHLVTMYGYRKQIEVRYERRAYMNDEVRITIDDNLRYIDAKPVSELNVLAIKSTQGWVNLIQMDHQLKNEGFLILEVKHQNNLPGWIEKCLKHCNAKQVKFSKYCGAVLRSMETKNQDGEVSTLHSGSSELNKSLTAGSGMAAPSQLSGGAALGKENIETKKAPDLHPLDMKTGNTYHTGTTKGLARYVRSTGKEHHFEQNGKHFKIKRNPNSQSEIKKSNKWLARAEQAYKAWNKKDQFEKFMQDKMPDLTKGQIQAIGQTLALKKSIEAEKILAKMIGLDKTVTLAKSGGEDSIYTLILFEGCDLHDILHCSHFATDTMTSDTYNKIKSVCDEYFEKEQKSQELEFKESGELGKNKQKVLFLSDGNPYKDLFDKLDTVAPYKYSKFRPHISVTNNVDEFKGKAASLVISVNGEIKKKYSFK